MSGIIGSDEVRNVAKLARLRLSGEEEQTLTKQLGDILGLIQKLSELDTDGVEPFTTLYGTVNVLRDDENARPLGTDSPAANAPESTQGYYTVPKIIQSA